MPDQTNPSQSSTRQTKLGGRHIRSDRSAHRAIGAAIVAGGLAFSVSLYPLPDQSQLLELYPPKGALSDFPKLIDVKSANHKLAAITADGLSDFPKLFDFLNTNFQDFPTAGLLDLVNTLGLPASATSLDVLKSLESFQHTFPGASGGGGGGGGGSAGIPVDVLPALLVWLEFLQQHFPTLGLADVLTNVLPAFGKLFAVAIPSAPTASVGTMSIAAAPVAPAPPPPGPVVGARVSGPPDPSVTAFSGPVDPPMSTVSATVDPPMSTVSATVDPPVSTVSATVAPPVSTVSTPTEASVSPSAQAPDPTPVRPKISVPDPKLPKISLPAPKLPKISLPDLKPPKSNVPSPGDPSPAGGGSPGGTPGGSPPGGGSTP
jgi:hypothetical protein